MRHLARLAVLVALGAPSVAGSAPAVTAVPISTRAPAWYTDAFHGRVMAAGDRGVALPGSTAIPASVAFLGIRPGQLIIVTNAPGTYSLCSTNFVFRDRSNYAIGTAGHCGSPGDAVSMVFLPGVVKNIGFITKSVNGGLGNDFALISIRSSLKGQVSPSMPFWGGPKKAYTSSAVPLLVEHSGWGLVIGTGGTPRAGIGTSYSSNGYTFLGAINIGDSGSGAVTGDKRALGNITHILAGLDENGLHTAAGTSIQRILQIAGLPLATCASTIPWPLYGCP